MTRKHKALEFAGIIILFLVLACYRHWLDLPFRPGANTKYHDHLLHVWILGWDGWAIFHNPFHLFDANIFYPALNTLALSDSMLGLLPNYLLGYLMSGDYVAAHNWAYFFTYLISGAGAYYFFRYWKIHPVARVAAAVFYTFYLSPFIFDQIQLSGFGFTFLVLLFLEKYLKEGKKVNLIFMSVSYIIGFLYGFYFAYMLTIVFWIYLLISWAMDRELVTFKKLKFVLSAYVVSLLVLFPAIIPYLILRYKANILSGTAIELLIEWSNAIGVNFKDWLIFIAGTSYHRLIVIVGLPLLIWVSDKNKRRGILIFAAVAVLFHVLTLGPYLKIGQRVTNIPMPYFLFTIIPGFMDIRFIRRFEYMTFVFEASLLALLLSYLLGKIDSYKKITILKLSLGVIAIIILLYPFQKMYLNPLDTVPAGGKLPPIYQKLASMNEDAVIAEFPILPSIWASNYAYQYFSLFHRMRLFNGFSGYTPFGNLEAVRVDRPADEWVAFFRAIGVKYIVSHPKDFIARTIENNMKEMNIRRIELEPPQTDNPNTTLWMDPIEVAIYEKVLDTKDINKALANLNTSIEAYLPANIAKDLFIIDLGHNQSSQKPPQNIPPLPSYAIREGNILKISQTDFERLIQTFGEASQYILLKNGVRRIEVSGFRKAIGETIKSPFADLTDEEAQKLGLTKIADEDGSIIWRIESASFVLPVNEPVVRIYQLKTAPGEIKIGMQLLVSPGMVWKNPSIYGVLQGHFELRRVGTNEIVRWKEFVGLPLAVTEYRPFATDITIHPKSGRDYYNLSINFPELSQRKYDLVVDMSK